ncbi:hypothetical protein F5050DRAFT_1729057 [Lentinula boryana]|uniref:Uncharacterized protein n=1 Tax=Lentinula boryana TaxID=40481 RepID=A0ABQ8QQ58_9AGAR|nr:hypothetical protein F5050DRAFT_1729057 [Lentinula boryana]
MVCLFCRCAQVEYCLESITLGLGKINNMHRRSRISGIQVLDLVDDFREMVRLELVLAPGLEELGHIDHLQVSVIINGHTLVLVKKTPVLDKASGWFGTNNDVTSVLRGPVPSYQLSDRVNFDAGLVDVLPRGWLRNIGMVFAVKLFTGIERKVKTGGLTLLRVSPATNEHLHSTVSCAISAEIISFGPDQEMAHSLLRSNYLL